MTANRAEQTRSSLEDALIAIIGRAGAVEVARLGVPEQAITRYNVPREAAERIARELADEAFGSIIDTAGSRVKDFVSEQMAAGKDQFEIAEALRSNYTGVSRRQAQMVARSVTREAYNRAALDRYEALGVTHVIAMDGFGGLTGKTDKKCVDRNGKRFSISQARQETEHPNGTLGWRPEIPEGGLQPRDLPPIEIAASLTDEEWLAEFGIVMDPVRELPRRVWDAAKHPRWPKGHGLAGKFRRKNAGAPKEVFRLASGERVVDHGNDSYTVITHTPQGVEIAIEYGPGDPDMIQMLAELKRRGFRRLDELRVRRLVIASQDDDAELAVRAFDPELHPRDPGGEQGGQFIEKILAVLSFTPGDVADRVTEFQSRRILSSPGMREAAAGEHREVFETEMARSHYGFKRKFEGRIATDPEFLAALMAAVRANRKSDLFQTAVRAWGSDHVVPINRPTGDPDDLLDHADAIASHAPSMGLTMIRQGVYEDAQKLVPIPGTNMGIQIMPTGGVRLGITDPGDPVTTLEGGLPATLRHEYAHHIHLAGMSEAERERLRRALPGTWPEEREQVTADDLHDGDRIQLPDGGTATVVETDPSVVVHSSDLQQQIEIPTGQTVTRIRGGPDWSDVRFTLTTYAGMPPTQEAEWFAEAFTVWTDPDYDRAEWDDWVEDARLAFMEILRARLRGESDITFADQQTVAIIHDSFNPYGAGARFERATLDLAFEEIEHPRDPGGEQGGQFIRKGTTAINETLLEIVKGWQQTRPWERPKADFVRGEVPGFTYLPPDHPRASRGVAARMPAGADKIEIMDGGFDTNGRTQSNLLYHEVGHNVAVHLLNHAPDGGLAGDNPDTDARRALRAWYHPTTGYQGRQTSKWWNPWSNPTGEFPSYSDNPEEIVAEAYAQLIHGDLENRTTFVPGVHGPEGEGFTAEEIAGQQKWRDLYAWIAKGARELGLPDHRLWRYERGADGEYHTVPVGEIGLAFEEAKHPRDPGGEGGGRFVKKLLGLPKKAAFSHFAPSAAERSDPTHDAERRSTLGQLHELVDHIHSLGDVEDRDVRAQAKINVAKRLAVRLKADPDWSVEPFKGTPHYWAEEAAREFEDEHMAGNLVDEWAATSGDRSLRALLIQKAAAAEFDRPWTPENEAALTEAKRAFEQMMSYDNIEETYPPIEKSLRAYVRAAYAETQAELERQGITHVRLYRGMKGSFGEWPGMHRTDITSNPLSSWTVDYDIARGFAKGQVGAAGVILSALVPRERIFGLPTTGPGCLPEWEVVLLGGLDTVAGFHFLGTDPPNEITYNDLLEALHGD